jgi:hypothetical protein
MPSSPYLDELLGFWEDEDVEQDEVRLCCD